MDLQEFVATTLSQISLGVTNAKNHDDRIAPKIGVGEDNPKVLRTSHGAEGVFLVEFDVAVTVEKGTADGSTVLAVASAKGAAKRSTENSAVNRVKFSVPISYW
jgi:hypothetical protein